MKWSFLCSLNSCRHWKRKLSGISTGQKIVSIMLYGTPNTWFSEGSLWINCWNQVFSRSQCKQLYGPSMDIHKFRICELVLDNTYKAEHNSKLVSKLVLQIFILSQLSRTFNMSQCESGITGMLITNHSFNHAPPSSQIFPSQRIPEKC